MIKSLASLPIVTIFKHALSLSVMMTFAIPVILSIYWQIYPQQQDFNNMTNMFSLTRLITSSECSNNSTEIPLNLLSLDDESSFPYVQRNIYNVAEAMIEEFQNMSTRSITENPWTPLHVPIVNVENALLDGLALNSSLPCNYAQRMFFDLHSNKDLSEIQQYLNTWQGLGLFIVPKMKYPTTPFPVHKVEWFNGTIDLLHIPILSLFPWSRRELIVLRVFEKLNHRIYTVKSLFPNEMLKQILIAHAANYRQYDQELLENFQYLTDRYIQLTFGMQLIPYQLKEDELVGEEETQKKKSKYHYHVQVVRYSNVLSSFPLLKKYFHDRYFMQYVYKKIMMELS